MNCLTDGCHRVLEEGNGRLTPSQIMGRCMQCRQKTHEQCSNCENWGIPMGRPDSECQICIHRATPSSVQLVGPAINNHTCPTCKNTRCNRAEGKCWWCGEAL